MSTKNQRFCAWCGPIMMTLWGVGFAVFAGFVPPPSPQDSPQEIADMLRDNTNSIRFGVLLTVAGCALLGPFVGVIAMHMSRIEGRQSPLAYAQILLGACLALEFILPLMALQTAAYRSDRSPEIVQMLDDLCWIPFFGVTTTAALQAILFGIVILQDRRDVPLFPRWSGYFNIWMGTLFTPGAVLVFFKDGPFAWDGIFVFWMPVIVFTSWILVITWLMIRSTNRQETARAAAADSTDPDVDVQRQLGALTAEMAVLREELSRVSASK